MALKWVFLFVRYFGLAYQMCVKTAMFTSQDYLCYVIIPHRGNKLMTYAIPLLPPGHVCKPWYLIQMISGQLITTGVDYILMLRSKFAGYRLLNIAEHGMLSGLISIRTVRI